MSDAHSTDHRYIPASPTDLRSPCPAVNTLANHGYISRSGRNIRANEIYAALSHLGCDNLLSAIFSYPIYAEVPASNSPKPPKASWWSVIKNPLKHVFSKFAMRNPGQTDAEGKACLNLDQLSRHGVVEHDVSLSRFDTAQGDNHSRQPELIKDMLAASSNGSTLTISDLVALRKRRHERQSRENPEMQYGSFENTLASAEIALILKVLGNGHEVPVSYVKALFGEERLPTEEGWKKRVWWRVGFVELNILATKVKGLLGDSGAKEGHQHAS
ncbi:MAG: hypothetical protein Q9190_005513 [Brigantiaea leucoxantha]